MKTYFTLIIRNLPREAEDILTYLCFERGCEGIAERLQWEQKGLQYEPVIVPSEDLVLEVYFEQTPPPQLFEDIQSHYPKAIFDLAENENQDWLSEWKKHFKPVPLVGDYWVVPSWLEAPPEAKKVLHIDPGMAFGTGTHATTQLAAQLILEVCRDLKRPFSALDVGTGTAILALLLKYEGGSPVRATEIDPIARDVGRENLLINEAQDVVILDEQIESLTQKYDVVVANIIDGVLIQLKPHLIHVLKPNGKMILTGILNERADLFEAQFLGDQWGRIITKATRDEWWGYVVEFHS